MCRGVWCKDLFLALGTRHGKARALLAGLLFGTGANSVTCSQEERRY